MQPRAATLGRQLDLDRRRPRADRRRRIALLPAPGEDEPVRRIELDVLTGRDVSGDHLAPEHPARLRLELRVSALPLLELLRVDEELPDGLRAGVDRYRPLDDGCLSRCVHASVAPPSLLRV